MQLTVNGALREVSEGLSVAELVRLLQLDDGPVAVERNREVVPRAEHEAVTLQEGDTIEIVHLVGGG